MNTGHQIRLKKVNARRRRSQSLGKKVEKRLLFGAYWSGNNKKVRLQVGRN